MNSTRISMIDGIRGFSLLGILLANLLIFQYGIWGKDHIDFFSLSQIDKGAYSFVKIFIEGSFMPIFTFLFGYSMVMMKENLQRKGLKVKRHFVRRAIFLMMIGILHGTFLWEGDILFFYGMMSFFLLLFLNCKKKTLLIWGIVLTLLTAALSVGGGEQPFEEQQKIKEYIKETIVVYGSGTYGEINDHRNNESPMDFDSVELIIILFLGPLVTAPMFLFGMYAAKKRAFMEKKQGISFYLNNAIIFLPVGVLLKSLAHFYPLEVWASASGILGSISLSFGYIFLFAVLFSKLESSWLVRAFTNVGKLSMSNYLMQTLICTTIFYGYGLGLFGKVGVLNSIFLGLFIFGCQMIASTFYLKFLKTGPFEKVNRIWTYFSFSGKPKVKQLERLENISV